MVSVVDARQVKRDFDFGAFCGGVVAKEILTPSKSLPYNKLSIPLETCPRAPSSTNYAYRYP